MATNYAYSPYTRYGTRTATPVDSRLQAAKESASASRYATSEDARQWNQKLAAFNQQQARKGSQISSLSNLANVYNRMYAEAQAKNEAKYQAQLGLVDQTSGQQAADIRSDYTKQRSSALQNLARSGMSGTTVGATLSQGLGREQSSALNRLADTMLQSKLGVMQGYEYKGQDPAITNTLMQALTSLYGSGNISL